MGSEHPVKLLTDGRPGVERWNALRRTGLKLGLQEAAKIWTHVQQNCRPGEQTKAMVEGFIRAVKPRVILEEPNFTGADLRTVDFSNCVLIRPSLRGANLDDANLYRCFIWQGYAKEASLRNVNLRNSLLPRCDFRSCDFTGADLTEANLDRADLSYCILRNATIRQANLGSVRLVDADLSASDISESVVYGVAAWDLDLNGTKQNNLVVSHVGDARITVDDIEIAQFIYMLINNKRVRRVIDAITSKVVLILGRFSTEQKPILEAIRQELRRYDYLPVLFDFDRPMNRDYTETISTLAHMARFIVVDITDPRSVPQELQRVVPQLPSVPVQPIIRAGSKEYGMFEHFTRFPWVLPLVEYEGLEGLLEALAEKVIGPAEEKARETQAAPKLVSTSAS